MKKKVAKLICLILTMMAITANAAFAKEIVIGQAEASSNKGDVIEPRSRYLASAISEVTNEGEGVLSIYADFASYSDVQWAQITIYLENRKGTSGSWSPVDTYVYEFTPEDTPDGRLHSGAVAFEVHGLTTDYYYRVRGVHKVQTPSGSYESKNTQTSGVLLTSYPVYRSKDEIR